MGLDLVEILMDVEDAFDIIIPEDAFPVSTVGEFVALVTGLLAKKQRTTQRCYCGHCFNALRKAVQQATGIEKQKIRPSTPLAEILRDKSEAQVYAKTWQGLGDKKHLLPELPGGWQLPRNLAAAACFYLAPVCPLGIFLYPASPRLPWFVLGILLLILANYFELHYAKRPGSIFHRSCFPPGLITIGDVARKMSAKLTPAEMGNASPLPAEIASQVKMIIADYAGVSFHQLKDSDRLVEDLNLG